MHKGRNVECPIIFVSSSFMSRMFKGSSLFHIFLLRRISMQTISRLTQDESEQWRSEDASECWWHFSFRFWGNDLSEEDSKHVRGFYDMIAGEENCTAGGVSCLGFGTISKESKSCLSILAGFLKSPLKKLALRWEELELEIEVKMIWSKATQFGKPQHIGVESIT